MDITEEYAKVAWAVFELMRALTETEPDVQKLHMYICPDEPKLEIVALTMMDGTPRFIVGGEVCDHAAPF